MKILVNTPSGAQEIIQVESGGGYFDASRVLWDERVDGPMPDITLGGMVRQGDMLAFDTARKAQHDAVVFGDARIKKIAETKAEAKRRIYAVYPKTKQMNMHTRHTELLAIESGQRRDGDGVLQPARALTASEVTELAENCAALMWVRSVRAASDLIEADIGDSTDPANFDVVNSLRWPV